MARNFFTDKICFENLCVDEFRRTLVKSASCYPIALAKYFSNPGKYGIFSFARQFSGGGAIP
jgi:hypothetical protein